MAAVPEASILVVEDDPEFVVDLLTLWHPAGSVRWAASGTEALERIAEFLPQLILLDLCLPSEEEDGLRLLSTIRQSWGLDLPVVVVTRSDSEAVKERALSLGAAAFVRKPIDVAEFDRVVREALRAPAAGLN